MIRGLELARKVASLIEQLKREGFSDEDSEDIFYDAWDALHCERLRVPMGEREMRLRASKQEVLEKVEASRLRFEPATGRCQECGEWSSALQVWFTPIAERIERGQFCSTTCFRKHWDVVATIIGDVTAMEEANQC